MTYDACILLTSNPDNEDDELLREDCGIVFDSVFVVLRDELLVNEALRVNDSMVDRVNRTSP